MKVLNTYCHTLFALDLLDEFYYLSLDYSQNYSPSSSCFGHNLNHISIQFKNSKITYIYLLKPRLFCIPK